MEKVFQKERTVSSVDGFIRSIVSRVSDAMELVGRPGRPIAIPVYVTGVPGSGKSSIGNEMYAAISQLSSSRDLGERLFYFHIDTDFYADEDNDYRINVESMLQWAIEVTPKNAEVLVIIVSGTSPNFAREMYDFNDELQKLLFTERPFVPVWAVVNSAADAVIGTAKIRLRHDRDEDGATEVLREYARMSPSKMSKYLIDQARFLSDVGTKMQYNVVVVNNPNPGWALSETGYAS